MLPNSRSAGPAGTDPLSAELPGHTPGALGRNDSAEPSKAPSWLDKIPGVKVAWNLDGHTAISKAAARRFGSSLGTYDPRFVDLDNIDWNVVFRDIEDLFSGGHWSPEGQRHHFMRAANQTQSEAWREGVRWIFNNTLEAAEILKPRIDCMNVASERIRSNQKWSSKDLLSCMRTREVERPLGNALHALQDSFAPAHVKRDANTLVIREILYYDSTRLKDFEDKVLPGQTEHESLDETWKGPDGNLSPLGSAAADASVALFRCLVAAGLARDPGRDLMTRFQNEVVEKFLKSAVTER